MNALDTTATIRRLIPALALLAATAACAPDAPSKTLEPDLTLSAEQPSYTPFTEAPALTNIEEVQAALTEAYPTLLRDAGIGGRASVWFLIGSDGRVEKTILHEGSGHEALDRAALSVADVYRFRPAENDGVAVAVWVSLPITFQVS